MDELQAAKLEFDEIPMDNLYNHPIKGIPSRSRVKAIMNELGDIRGKVVLDAGCEAGYLSFKLADMGGAKVIAFDIIKPAIKKLRKNQTKGMDITPFVWDIHNIPLDDNSVDAIVCTEVIEHIDNLGTALWELERVLKPNCKLIVTFPNESNRKHFYRFLPKVSSLVHLHSYDSGYICRRLGGMFHVEKAYQIPFILNFTNVIVCRK